MQLSDMSLAQFPSKATSAGVVNVMLGFVPDFAILISAIGATSPDIFIWANNDIVSAWAVALALKLTGTTGVVTRDTTGIAAYAGGDRVTTTETADTDGKHVDQDGDFITVPAGSQGVLTSPGLAIPADAQTAGDANLLIAFRANR